MKEAASPTQTTTGYLALVRRNANFRFLWFGQIISLLGDWFNLIASAALIAQLTESGLAVGALFVVRMLAPFLISPLAGAWADRFDRRRLLILTDLTRGLTVLGFFFVRQPEHLWLLYTLTGVQLAISGVFFPTRNAILPDLVSRSELGAANALSSATWSVMLALGAALGGISAGTWGIYPSFAIDASTFFISAFFIYQIKYSPKVTTKAKGASLPAFLKQYLRGLRYLKEHADTLAITLLKAGAALTISGAFQVVQVQIAEQIYVIGAGGGISLGLMYTLVGVGTGLGPIFARRITGDRDRSLRVAILISYAISSIGLATAATLSSFGVVLLGALLRGVGVGLNWVFSTQLLLQLLPDHVRGRVFATEFALLTLMNATGAAVGGWALDNTTLGAAGLLTWMAGLALIPGLLWGLWLAVGRRAEPLGQARN